MTPDDYVSAVRHVVAWHDEDEAGAVHSRTPERYARDRETTTVLWVHIHGADWLGVWQFIQATIDVATGEEDVLRYIGAGDLESLIMWHGDELIDEIESKAPTNRSLRVALSNVWGWGPIEDRIERLLTRLGPPSRNPPKR